MRYLLVFTVLFCCAFSCDEYKAKKKEAASKTTDGLTKQVYPKYCRNETEVHDRIEFFIDKAFFVHREEVEKALLGNRKDVGAVGAIVCKPIIKFAVNKFEEKIIKPKLLECDTEAYLNGKKEIIEKGAEYCEKAIILIASSL